MECLEYEDQNISHNPQVVRNTEEYEQQCHVKCEQQFWRKVDGCNIQGECQASESRKKRRWEREK